MYIAAASRVWDFHATKFKNKTDLEHKLKKNGEFIGSFTSSGGRKISPPGSLLFPLYEKPWWLNKSQLFLIYGQEVLISGPVILIIASDSIISKVAQCIGCLTSSVQSKLRNLAVIFYRAMHFERHI